MKQPIMMALTLLFLVPLMQNANAGTITTTTTTKTTTVTTVKKSKCTTHVKKKSHHRRYASCTSSPCYSAIQFDDYSYDDQCPGGAYNCYFDLQGHYFQQDYYPISYANEVYYR